MTKELDVNSIFKIITYSSSIRDLRNSLNSELHDILLDIEMSIEILYYKGVLNCGEIEEIREWYKKRGKSNAGILRKILEEIAR